MPPRKRALSAAAKQDIAGSQRRAKAARTPAAKAITKRVVETKQRAHSGEAARESAEQMRRGVHPLAVGTKAKGSTPVKKATPGKK